MDQGTAFLLRQIEKTVYNRKKKRDKKTENAAEEGGLPNVIALQSCRPEATA